MTPRENFVDTLGQSNDRFLPDLKPKRTCSVRQQLRDATSEVHEALHDHPDFVSLLEERMTRIEYRALLARLYGYYWALERGLRATSPAVLRGFNVRERERSADLRADLLFLGLSRNDIDALPVCEALMRPVRSNAELMGRLYVVEGAALGGKIIASKLDRLLGAEGVEGRRFFSGRALPDPLPWPAFCRLLESESSRSGIRAVIEGAETTFRNMADWLTDGAANV